MKRAAAWGDIASRRPSGNESVNGEDPFPILNDHEAQGLWHGEDYGPKARFIPAWANGPGHRHTQTLERQWRDSSVRHRS